MPSGRNRSPRRKLRTTNGSAQGSGIENRLPVILGQLGRWIRQPLAVNRHARLRQRQFSVDHQRVRITARFRFARRFGQPQRLILSDQLPATGNRQPALRRAIGNKTREALQHDRNRDHGDGREPARSRDEASGAAWLWAGATTHRGAALILRAVAQAPLVPARSGGSPHRATPPPFEPTWKARLRRTAP